MKSPEELLKAGHEAENERDRCFGPFRLKPVERTLLGPSGPVQLTPKEFEILHVLVKNIGMPVSGETLLREVWQDTSVDPNNVPQVIGRLRRKLGKNDVGQDYIITLPNVGYLLSAPTGTGPSVGQLKKTVADPRESSAIVTPSGNPNRILVPNSRALLSVIILLLIVLGGILYLSLHRREERLLVWETGNVTHDHRPKRGPVLCDGRRIWFEEEVQGTWRVVSVSIEGGEATPLQAPLEDVRLQDIAVDGSALLLSAKEGNTRTVWSWPVFGGAPQMLPPQTGDAGWAPDKRSIAFGSATTLILATGTAPPSFVAMPSRTIIALPRWSPQNAHITFQLVDRKTGERRLWLADRLGGHLRPVPGAKDTGEDQAGGLWTRDGRYYVFAGGSRTSRDLWVLRNPEGFFGSHFAKASRLTHGPVSWDWPTPGRNTGELFAMGESVQGRLVSLDRAGSVWRTYLDGVPAYELDFSRDAAWVAYVRYPDHTLWKSRVDGSERVQLTSPGEFEAHQPHWSPDGTRIAFMSQRPGAHWRVMIVKPGGTIEEPLPGGEDQGVPTWSPDGRKLLFGDLLFGKDAAPMRLHILDLFTHRTAPMVGSDALWSPRWSPNGAYISALSQNSKSLMLAPAGKSSWREIMNGKDLDDATWSSDSRHIYLTTQALKQLHRVNVLTGQVEELADLRHFPFAREQWFGVAPDGSPLALQAFPEQEIYSLHWVLP